ncbi:hypothetical protein F5X97DRAFT_344165 [Nemania serpens]|nr:hypothetical protein F5X97DRAFT_344165 [Nemania serpens]
MSSKRFSQTSRSSLPYPSFPPSRPGSGDSSKSSGGSAREHEMSVNFYSPGNGHWAAYSGHRDGQMGTIQHVRSDPEKDQDRFYYDEKPHSSDSPSLYGRSVVARMSASEVARAQASIRDYASNDDNIPRGIANTFLNNMAGPERKSKEGCERTGGTLNDRQKITFKLEAVQPPGSGNHRPGLAQGSSTWALTPISAHNKAGA